MSSFTLYKIETRSNLSGGLFNPEKVYVNERRFNDFK
jgi:hypothetical protein